MTAVLETRRLNAGYERSVVVRDLDLHVEAGEVVALLGPNGAGKTTTIMTVAGAIPPLAGEVLINGEVTRSSMHRRVADGLGLIGEQRTVLMKLTVAENLRLSRGDPDLALKLFPELEEPLTRKVGILSGGQQQILALARALSRRPSLLLADELSLGLAPLIVARLLKTVRDAADSGVAVLLVEQHVQKALEIADRAYVLQRGRIVLAGPAAELRGRMAEVEASYFATMTS